MNDDNHNQSLDFFFFCQLCKYIFIIRSGRFGAVLVESKAFIACRCKYLLAFLHFILLGIILINPFSEIINFMSSFCCGFSYKRTI